jgi:hypothetical protein
MHNPQNSSLTGRTAEPAGSPAASALKPALASIPDACKYMGDVSRSKFYADLLPRLETVHIGSRHFVVVASMDRLIENLKGARLEASREAAR